MSSQKNSSISFAVSAALLLSCMSAPAFTVVKNVNDGRPPVEKLVIFEKGKPRDHIILEDKVGDCKMGFTESGAIEVFITGNQAIQPVITWKPTDKIPKTFNVSDYNYVILTCALEGDIKRTTNGKVSPYRPDDLWFSVTMYDAARARSGVAGLAALCEDKKTPKDMVTLKIPMMLFANGPLGDVTKIEGFGFPWNKTHDYYNRDFRLVIEKIALAD